MPVNKFIDRNGDDWTFVTIEGFPDFAKVRIALETRHGVHGHGLWQTGIRGEPFELMTFRDVLDGFDAIDTVNNYIALIGTQVEIVWNDIEMGEKYDILNMKVTKVKKTTGGVGGELGASGAYVKAVWTVIPIVDEEGKTTRTPTP